MQRKDAIDQKIFRVEENHQNRRGSKGSFKVLSVVFLFISDYGLIYWK
jgi:hypothetical protein